MIKTAASRIRFFSPILKIAESSHSLTKRIPISNFPPKFKKNYVQHHFSNSTEKHPINPEVNITVIVIFCHLILQDIPLSLQLGSTFGPEFFQIRNPTYSASSGTLSRGTPYTNTWVRPLTVWKPLPSCPRNPALL